MPSFFFNGKEESVLPDELALFILDHLTPREKLQSRRVSQYFQSLLNTDWLWRPTGAENLADFVARMKELAGWDKQSVLDGNMTLTDAEIRMGEDITLSLILPAKTARNIQFQIVTPRFRDKATETLESLLALRDKNPKIFNDEFYKICFSETKQNLFRQSNFFLAINARHFKIIARLLAAKNSKGKYFIDLDQRLGMIRDVRTSARRLVEARYQSNPPRFNSIKQYFDLAHQYPEHRDNLYALIHQALRQYAKSAPGRSGWSASFLRVASGHMNTTHGARIHNLLSEERYERIADEATLIRFLQEFKSSLPEGKIVKSNGRLATTVLCLVRDFAGIDFFNMEAGAEMTMTTEPDTEHEEESGYGL
ncbi:F-box-like domain-containing protein [Legionella spiritensis]|uniref:F-box domain-containing protein n=1 Tax=Legionella spiritensis TaxID=452 RepID=A0A0W0Z740_LEGSP|nr:F-box-like domain-containing protein [Legionella spiritensis]KTD64751.1 hypothetical protein Lspi_0918 [Legionella spiritensis]SNV48200.1 Uncharacterised protein [Legionella spiritensis]